MYLFFFKCYLFIYIYLRETERERKSTSAGGAERGRQRIWSRLHVDSRELHAGTWTEVGHLPTEPPRCPMVFVIVALTKIGYKTGRLPGSSQPPCQGQAWYPASIPNLEHSFSVKWRWWKSPSFLPEKETKGNGKRFLSILNPHYFGRKTSTQQAFLSVFSFTFFSHSSCPSFLRLTFNLGKKISYLEFWANVNHQQQS